MTESGNWCLIESDPGVFTELIKEYGVTGVQVEEIYALDQESFERIQPVLGVIFLFKFVPGATPSGEAVKDPFLLDNIFFAKQMINNACATQAILSVLLNSDNDDLKLGSTLSEFKEFCMSFDPQLKGMALSNSETIRTVHNSFARQTVFEFDSKAATKDDDVFHFVSYIPFMGRVLELDGLKEGPFEIGKYESDTNWTDIVSNAITARISNYNVGEIHFNLMAVVTDRKIIHQRKIDELKKAVEQGGTLDVPFETQLSYLQNLIQEEELKFQRYRVENIRRKHNYLPLIMEVLKILAAKRKLCPMYLKAKEKAIELDNKKKEKKAKTA